MSRFTPVARAFAATIFAFGIGCGSSGGGCGGLTPLPADPKPHGFPPDQIIEGGVQARITKPGVQKLSQAIVDLVNAQLMNGFCAVPRNHLININNFALTASLDMCNVSSAACAPGKGCATNVRLSSPDGKDGVTITVPSGNPPTLTLGIKFDLNFNLHFDYNVATLGGSVNVFGPSSCDLNIYNAHYNTSSADPLAMSAFITLGIDPVTGELTLKLSKLTVDHLDIGSSGCGVVGDIINYVGTAIDFLANLDILGFKITDIITSLLQPQLDALVQGFLPKPLGLAGTLDAGKLLAKFNPPANSNLEMFLVPGGYVQAVGGGLNLGVMSGFNSDRDQSTRAPGLSSEPSLCVPNRPTPELSGAPWNLPFNPSRKDYTLAPAGEFSGNPEPMGANGIEDVAIGISRTYLDLAGFHIYNSGTLCLAIGGDALPQLNAGTLSVLVMSLGNLLENRTAPLALVLRPQTPLSFTIGTGTMTSPLLNVGVSDLRIDFYGWIEERYVRIFTVGVDLNLGVNLSISKNATTMQPEIEPMLVGLDAKNITVRVSNTDLLHELPADLAGVFPSLINIAAGAVAGSLPKVPLPSVAGFSLDDLTISRAQTGQDDFLGIYGTIKVGTPAGLIDWSDPQHPRMAGELRTRAVVSKIIVPSAADLAKLYAAGQPAPTVAQRPRVQLDLSTLNQPSGPVEYSWRVQYGTWQPWTTNAHPTLADDVFLLQGRYQIEVRSRVVNEWQTEDSTPSVLSVLIDSIAPEVHPARDVKNADRIVFGGFDMVSPPEALVYAWNDESGKQQPWTSDDFMSMDLAKRLSENGRRQIMVYAKDEAGNVAKTAVDLGPLLGFHGRTTDPPAAGGCGCEVGAANQSNGARNAGILVGLLFGLVWLRRRRAQAAAALLLVGLLSLTSACNSNAGGRCNLDDECLKLACDTGELPSCVENMCQCIAGLQQGDVGRFASMTLIGPDAYVAAYNNTYGDLMIGHVLPPGVISDWEFIDGVPDEAPSRPGDPTRGGVETPGEDVGRYTSIGVNVRGEPVVSYYDNTNKRLKFASFSVIRWASHAVDEGSTIEGSKNDTGRWSSMNIGPDGKPAIAYYAVQKSATTSGNPEGQLRVAQAKTALPRSSADWIITIVDRVELPAVNTDMAATTPLLPEGTGLMASLARQTDGSLGVVYYDRTRGNLRYATNVGGIWGAPVTLDGEAMDGSDTGDVGQYPSLVYDATNVGHISYVDATHDNLLYVNTKTNTPEVADDGYRPKDEQTLDGIDSPVYHLVGDSSSIQIASGQVLIAYQDSTTVQLRLAARAMDGKWTLNSIAGHAKGAQFGGSYGFYADLKLAGVRGVVSSYAINQSVDPSLFFVEVFDVDLGLIM